MPLRAAGEIDLTQPDAAPDAPTPKKPAKGGLRPAGTIDLAPPLGTTVKPNVQQPQTTLEQGMVAAGTKGPEAVSGTPETRAIGEFVRRQEPDIDYKTGAKFSTQLHFEKAANPREAGLTLEQMYGPGNFGQDKYGTWWVRENGKRVAIIPAGLKGSAEKFAAQTAGSGVKQLGIAGGAVAGEALFPMGGGIPGAMIGAVLGEGADDVIKWAQGVFAQKPGEVVGNMATAGAVAGFFQGTPAVAQRAKQGIQNFAQKFTAVSPESRRMGRAMAAEGAVPPIGSYAPGASILEYEWHKRNMLKGHRGRTTYGQQRNIEVTTRMMRDELGLAGYSPPEIETMMAEIADKTASASPRPGGEAVVAKAQQIHGEHIANANAIMDGVEQSLREQETTLRAMAQAPEVLPVDIGKNLVQWHDNFNAELGKGYTVVDKMNGDEPIVHRQLIKTALNKVLGVLDPTVVPALLKSQAARSAREGMTFAEAHALRTSVRKLAGMDVSGKVVDIAARSQQQTAYLNTYNAINRAMNAASRRVGPQQLAALNRLEEQEAKGMALFEHTTVQQMVREAQTGTYPNPETFVRYFMNEDNLNVARGIWEKLPDATRHQVVQADLSSMIESSARYDAAGNRVMDGKSFMELLDTRSKLLSEFYPPKQLEQMRAFAKDLSFFDAQLNVGKNGLDVTKVANPSVLIGKMQEAVGALRAADDFAKKNPLGALLSGKPIEVDRALANITTPKNEAVTEAAALTLGRDSEEWRQVQKYAMQSILSKATKKNPALGLEISGRALEGEIGPYTKRQLELLFPGGVIDGLKNLAMASKFLFPAADTGEALPASLAAGAIKDKLWWPHAAVKYGWSMFWGWIADNPRLLRFLTDEVKRDPPHGRSLFNVVMQNYMLNNLDGRSLNRREDARGQAQKTQAAPPFAPMAVPQGYGGPIE